MSKRIVIPLPNGFKLVAEGSTDPNYPYEIYVGILGEDDVRERNLSFSITGCTTRL